MVLACTPNVLKRYIALFLFVQLGFFMFPSAQAVSVSKVMPQNLRRQRHEMNITLAREALAQKRITDTIRHLKHAAPDATNPARTYSEISQLYTVQSKPLEALSAINLAIDHAPQQHEYLSQKAEILSGLSQQELAIQTMQHAITLDPNNGQYYFDMGVWQSSAGQYEAAAKSSLKAISLAYNLPAAYNNYGYALTHLGRFQQASRAIDEALKRQGSTQTAAALDSKGYVMFRLNEVDEALDWYAKALAQDPTLGEVHLHRAEAYEAKGDLKRALESYLAYLRFSETAPADSRKISERIRLLRQQIADEFLNPPAKTLEANKS